MDTYVVDEGCGCEYEVWVPFIEGTYAYPYISRIVGEHPLFRFKRKFLNRVSPKWCYGDKYYQYPLREPGIYEVGVKRWDENTKKLINREVEYFTYNDLDGMEEITRNEVEDLMFGIK